MSHKPKRTAEKAKNIKLKRGDTKVFQKRGSNLMLTLFKDKRLVHMLSTNCHKRISASGKPLVVENFNKHMGGVDLNDQLSMYYKAGRPSHKWWRYIFWFLLNVSITNAWILFKESGRAGGYTHVKFCMDLANGLKGDYTSRKQRPTLSPPHLALLQKDGHSLVRIDGRSRKCRMCSKNGRVTTKGHKKESSYECDVCKVGLCKNQCFFLPGIAKSKS